MQKISKDGIIIEVIGKKINCDNKLYNIKLDIIGNEYFIMNNVKYYLAYFKTIK